jgi:hypothetical protein
VKSWKDLEGLIFQISASFIRACLIEGGCCESGDVTENSCPANRLTTISTQPQLLEKRCHTQGFVSKSKRNGPSPLLNFLEE